MVYQVTPKLQTADEVAEQMRIFEAIESRLGLTPGCIVIGIMNEELGMTLQLSEALRAAQGRTFFTNTGFLDRTGSQIRAQMQAGAVDLRDDLTQATFNVSYERHNVDVSLHAGVHRHGKVGKGYAGSQPRYGRNVATEDRPSTYWGQHCMGTGPLSQRPSFHALPHD